MADGAAIAGKISDREISAADFGVGATGANDREPHGGASLQTMPHYLFEALDTAGEKVTGTLEAATRSDAYRQIESRHLFPVEVTEKSGAARSAGTNGANGKHSPAPANEVAANDDVTGPGPKLKRARLIYFTSELADLLDAGLPVQQALNVMGKSSGQLSSWL